MAFVTETPSLLKQREHGTWLEIRVDRLLHNIRQLKRAAGTSFTLAVIKANAYGHGLVETARALAGEVDFFGIASVNDALTLRRHGISTRILLFGRPGRDELADALMDDVSLSVSSLEEALEISRFSVAAGRRTPVHVKVDTGMGRFGLPAKEAADMIASMGFLPGIVLEGIYTHFPTAERPDGFTQDQVKTFVCLIDDLARNGIHFRYRHAANSAGIFTAAHPQLNMVRPGLMLYGIYPDPSLQNRILLKAVLALKSRIALVKNLEAGETAGYGRDFRAREAGRIAVLPVGYSHGYPFTASGKAFALFQGRRVPLAGRVSMDYVTLHLGSLAAAPRDEVTLLGEQGDGVIRTEDLAAWAGTIPYEIVTRLIPGLPRIYLSAP